ncbi:hypothetical protein EV360DRAFT_89027 [Lentinula raphanica]|nr:hypothetical protein EV360DRAFT_89027 [Lentinula raphanica]
MTRFTPTRVLALLLLGAASVSSGVFAAPTSTPLMNSGLSLTGVAQSEGLRSRSPPEQGSLLDVRRRGVEHVAPRADETDEWYASLVRFYNAAVSSPGSSSKAGLRKELQKTIRVMHPASMEVIEEQIKDDGDSLLILSLTHRVETDPRPLSHEILEDAERNFHESLKYFPLGEEKTVVENWMPSAPLVRVIAQAISTSPLPSPSASALSWLYYLRFPSSHLHPPPRRGKHPSFQLLELLGLQLWVGGRAEHELGHECKHENRFKLKRVHSDFLKPTSTARSKSNTLRDCADSTANSFSSSSSGSVAYIPVHRRQAHGLGRLYSISVGLSSMALSVPPSHSASTIQCSNACPRDSLPLLQNRSKIRRIKDLEAISTASLPDLNANEIFEIKRKYAKKTSSASWRFRSLAIVVPPIAGLLIEFTINAHFSKTFNATLALLLLPYNDANSFHANSSTRSVASWSGDRVFAAPTTPSIRNSGLSSTGEARPAKGLQSRSSPEQGSLLDVQRRGDEHVNLVARMNDDNMSSHEEQIRAGSVTAQSDTK